MKDNRMKFNKFSIILAAMLAGTSSLLYPMSSILKYIVRIERFEKPGSPTIDVFHDRHSLDYFDKEQEATMVKMFANQKACVYVEDMTQHVGSNNIINNIVPRIFNFARPGCLLGFVKRLQAAGVSASNVECRAGLTLNEGASGQEVAEDYINIRNGLKVKNPTDPVDKFGNEIIASLETTENNSLRDLQYSPKLRGSMVGDQALDILALKQLSKKDGNNYKALVAGGLHCEGVGLALVEKLGYKRTKCIEETSGKNGRTISQVYEPYLPKPNFIYTVVSAADMTQRIPSSIPNMPISSAKIEEYFEKPDSYKVS